MTEAEIDAMPAGPEMDRIVAQRVFGRALVDTTYRDGSRGMGIPGCPAYSTEIEAAWKIVVHLCPGRYMFLDADKEGFKCAFSRPDMDSDAVCSTAPVAICRAALKAMFATAAETR